MSLGHLITLEQRFKRTTIDLMPAQPFKCNSVLRYTPAFSSNFLSSFRVKGRKVIIKALKTLIKPVKLNAVSLEPRTGRF